MKEIKNFINQLELYINQGHRFAIATVFHVDGSAYRRPGARMIINEHGEWYGGISGGCLEGDMLKKAQMAMINNENKLVRYDTRDDDPFELGIGLGCNGLIQIVICPCLVYGKSLMEKLKKHLTHSEPSIFRHDFYFDQKQACSVEFLPIDSPIPDLTKSETDLLRQEHHTKYKLSENHLSFIEYLPPQIHIILYGHIFDSNSLIDLCEFLSWDVSWIGNPLKMNPTLKKKVKSFYHWDDVIPIHKNDTIVLMTHDFDRDVQIMSHLISINFTGYIGILGPLKRTDKLKKQLGILSVKIDENALFTPIGLDIGAEGPNEISLSIVSEIIAFKSARDGKSLKHRSTSIHTN